MKGLGKIMVTPSIPTLGGPNTGSTIGGALLGDPGENITTLGTILPISHHALSLCWKNHAF